MPLVWSPDTSRHSKPISNVFLLKCEQKEEPLVSKLHAQIFYSFPFHTRTWYINTDASGTSADAGRPVEQRLSAVIHYVLPELGLLRLCY